MITQKHSLPVQGMTYSQRRRLINLLWALVSNSVLPFLFGFVLAVVSLTYSAGDTVKAFDKSGFGVCIQPDLKETELLNTLPPFDSRVLKEL